MYKRQIDTKEKALAQIEEEKQKGKSKPSVEKKQLPQWYHDQDSVQNDRVVDEDALEKMLKELEGEQHG